MISWMLMFSMQWARAYVAMDVIYLSQNMFIIQQVFYILGVVATLPPIYFLNCKWYKYFIMFECEMI